MQRRLIPAVKLARSPTSEIASAWQCGTNENVDGLWPVCLPRESLSATTHQRARWPLTTSSRMRVVIACAQPVFIDFQVSDGQRLKDRMPCDGAISHSAAMVDV